MRFCNTAILFLGYSLGLAAATLPNGFSEQAISGINLPTAMTFAPDGRLFVCQQNGQLRVVKNGALLATPFLTVQTDTNGERGLVGVAVPDSQYVYVYYTVPGPPIRNRISRFTQNGDVALAGSEVVIMELETLEAINHNGGAMHFGPDGKLYVAVGENAVPANAQSFANRLGKILRFNADGSIPTDNPFYNTATGSNRSIWARGFRNPFTFAFQPGTGRMFINDVGQDAYEEVNEGVAGGNYGWPNGEGPTITPVYQTPFYYYAHTEGCAITGGTFYNPATGNFPDSYTGKYFFADYCSGWIRTLDPATRQVSGFATGVQSPVDLAVGPTGSLYYLARGSNAVYKVDYAAGQGPVITQHPPNVSVPQGETATFTVAASGQQPISFQWQKNQVDIPGATGSTLHVPAVTTADDGAQFRAKATNQLSSATSNAATLTVTQNSNNAAPEGVITAPAAGSLYSGGQMVAFAGTGTDTEDGVLPAANFCWVVDFHHDTHFHPFLPQTCGVKSGTVTIPVLGETSSNVWYRFHLTVRDSGGRTQTSYVDLQPRKVTITLQSNPAGLQLTLDGQPVTSPLQVTSVVGVVRNIGAPAQAAPAGSRLGFASWSDGGVATHDIATPAVNTTYTAAYTTQYLLTLSVSPLNAGTVTAIPGSADGYYNAGTSVQLDAAANAGFTFANWSGALGGSTEPQPLVMNGPANVAANFTGFGTCTYDLPRRSGSYGAESDLVRLAVVAPPGCSWAAVSNAGWLQVQSLLPGSGNGAVIAVMEKNLLPVERTGVITVAGISYTVTQSAAGCSFTLSRSTDTIPAAGGNRAVGVTTDAGCGWKAAPAPAWLTLVNAQNGATGPASLEIQGAGNSGNLPRLGSVQVGGQSLQLLQDAAAPQAPYADVPVGYLFAPYIRLLLESQIAYECSPTGYCPEQAIKRSEMAVMLARAVLGGNPVQYPQTPYFTDVPASHPQFASIQKLRELGVTAGCTVTTYCPNDPVTRGQMAAFLIRARFGLSSAQAFPFAPAAYFSDAPPANVFFGYIQKLRDLGITSGCTETEFCPNDATLRGQMAAFVARAFLTP